MMTPDPKTGMDAKDKKRSRSSFEAAIIPIGVLIDNIKSK